MKKFFGVTLVEVLLVCTASAMILVLAARYYQNVIAAEQANDMLQLINAITAGAEEIRAGSGNFNYVTTDRIKNIVRSMTTPWGTEAFIHHQEANYYTVMVPAMPAPICEILTSHLTANPHFYVVSECGLPNFWYRYYLSLHHKSAAIAATPASTPQAPTNSF